MEKSYELPEGQLFTIGHERFRCPEALFDPSLLGFSAPGLVGVLFDAIMRCDPHVDVRRELYANVVLSGGNTMFPGLAEHVAKDLKAMAPVSMESVIKVVGGTSRFSAWVGGSIVASSPAFQHSWVTREDYVKEGPAAVLRVCM